MVIRGTEEVEKFFPLWKDGGDYLVGVSVQLLYITSLLPVCLLSSAPLTHRCMHCLRGIDLLPRTSFIQWPTGRQCMCQVSATAPPVLLHVSYNRKSFK